MSRALNEPWTSEEALVNILKTLDGQTGGKVAELRKNALTDHIENMIVDTTKCFDTSRWETGVKEEGRSWVIVEEYMKEEEASAGHLKWVSEVKKGRKTFKSIQFEEGE